MSRYRANPLSVNSGIVSFIQELMKYRGRPNENVALFFDLSYFLVFQELLNDPQVEYLFFVSLRVPFTLCLAAVSFPLWDMSCLPFACALLMPCLQLPPSQVTLNPRLSFLGDLAAWVVRGFFCLWKTNRLLPIELLFSKKRAPQTFTTCRAAAGAAAAAAGDDEGDAAAAAEDAAITQHDFWCPASLPALRSLCSNYTRGTDAKVQHQMRLLPHLEPEEALKLAADEAAATYGGQTGSWGGGVWTHEEDCMLMQYFDQFRGVRDYYTYIAGNQSQQLQQQQQ